VLVRRGRLLRLEEEDGAVTEVKVDEVFRLVRDETTKVPADDAVPCLAFALIHRPLDAHRDILFDSEASHSLLGEIDYFLLQILKHIHRLDLHLGLVTATSDVLLEVGRRHCDMVMFG
jgi:hypothetical protein